MEEFEKYNYQQLQTLRIRTMRELRCANLILQMINEELAERTPPEQEAVVLEFRREE